MIAGALLGLATTLVMGGLWERSRLRLLVGLAHFLHRVGGEPTPGRKLNVLTEKLAAINKRLLARVDLLHDPDEVVDLVRSAKNAEIDDPDERG